MSYWKNLISKNNSEHSEVLNGKLLQIGNKEVLKCSFKYAVIQNRKYLSTTSILPGEFIEPNEIIYTSNTELAFTKGSQLILDDNVVMTIKDIENVLNPSSGKLKAYILTLDGGMPNEFN